MKQLPIALSPCPNDTFLFHAWIANLVGSELPVEPHYADIQTLNEWALKERFPLIKVSLGCYKEIQHAYEILPVGTALGLNNGPKLIAKKPLDLHYFASKAVAIPGWHTTAHLLLERLCQTFEHKMFCLYHEVFDLLDQNLVESGVIIHESRFTYGQRGFVEIVDLGALWHNRFSLPLPLGALAIRRNMHDEQKKKIVSILQHSLEFGRNNREASVSFIKMFAQEKNRESIDAHIALYVNEETNNLSLIGIRAIESLLDLDRSDWLYSSHG